MTSAQARLARALVLSAGTFGLIAASKPAPSSNDPVAVVRASFDAFNRGDEAALGALLAPDLSIIDLFPPHEWHGPNAYREWDAGFEKYAKAMGWTDVKLPITGIVYSRVEGNDAYVVIRGDFRYKEHGRPMSELGTEPVSLHKGADGVWKITGWAWAGQPPHAAVAKAKASSAAPAKP